MKSPTQTAVERIRELRKRHGWTQQQLADRLNQLGAQTDRAAVAKIETRKRGLSLDEAFQYALALDVAPIHLFVPVDGDEPVMLGANLTCSPAEARAWIRGLLPLFQDQRTYFAMVPLSEHKDAVNRLLNQRWAVYDPSEETKS